MKYENNLTKNFITLIEFLYKNYSQFEGKICIIDAVPAQKGLWIQISILKPYEQR
jgi:hypothetical protein